MPVRVRSFAKINLGLCIGPRRADRFHELRTVYQTIDLHDEVNVEIVRGRGIEIRCEDPTVPKDETNTCYQVVERARRLLKFRGKVIVEITKRLPVQGGLGGASGNAAATLLALERAAKKPLAQAERLRIAGEVGSDVPLFLIGGTVLGVGRGEEVYPVTDLLSWPCLVALPKVGVSTPRAFAAWDKKYEAMSRKDRGLTLNSAFDRMGLHSRRISGWLSDVELHSGVPARGRGRAENPLLDLVRTGIENDFEQVVFPEYPELRQVKRELERAGAVYASLSGSGSAVYGLFATRKSAAIAERRLRQQGTSSVVTSTLTRREYWGKLLVRK